LDKDIVDFSPKKSALILFSKGFAQHVGYNTLFVQSIINKLFKHKGLDHLEVTLAVVDRIPAPPDSAANALTKSSAEREEDAGLEGISFLVFDDTNSKTPFVISSSEFTSTPHISISIKPRGNSRAYKVKLPVANTLFENEKLNTLIHSKWTYKDGSLKVVDSADVQSVSVKFPQHSRASGRQAFGLSIPYSAITPIRMIEEGLGNVIRKISDPESQRVMPASAELQRELTTGLAHTGQIFAVVMPPDVYQTIQTKVKSMITTGSTEPNDLSPQAVTEMETVFLFKDLILHIKSGTSVRRVIGGGGEWGDRASLVTLEPTEPFETSTSIENDDISLSYIERLNSASIAPTGHYIQFFMSAVEHDSLSAFDEKAALNIGCISTDSVIQAHGQHVHSFSFNTFGGLSSLGIGVEAPPSRTISTPSTKHIDVQGSSFWLRYAASTETEKEIPNRSTKAIEHDQGRTNGIKPGRSNAQNSGAFIRRVYYPKDESLSRPSIEESGYATSSPRRWTIKRRHLDGPAPRHIQMMSEYLDIRYDIRGICLDLWTTIQKNEEQSQNLAGERLRALLDGLDSDRDSKTVVDMLSNDRIDGTTSWKQNVKQKQRQRRKAVERVARASRI
jgi:hypothetical protein